MSLRVVAHARAKEGEGAELQAVLEGLVEPTRAEDGCVSYELLSSLEDELVFTFVEEWRDGSALRAHLASPHIVGASARLSELLDGEVEVRTYRLIR